MHINKRIKDLEFVEQIPFEGDKIDQTIRDELEKYFTFFFFLGRDKSVVGKLKTSIHFKVGKTKKGERKRKETGREDSRNGNKRRY